MDPCVLQIFPCPLNQCINPVLTPPQPHTQWSQPPSRQPFPQVFLQPLRLYLLLLSFHPPIDRPIIALLHHINESRFSHPSPIIFAICPWPPQLLRCFHACGLKLIEGCTAKSPVDRFQRHYWVLEFEIAARGEICEDFGDYGWRVAEAWNKGSTVDIVEGPGVDPITFCVVDPEATIWWDATKSC